MPPKLGILAGSGDLPRRIIRACRDEGRDFFVIAFKSQTDAETVVGIPHAWVRLGAGGKSLEHLRREGVEELVFAGGIRRPSLSQTWPDIWSVRFFCRTGAAALGDDGLLSAIVRELGKVGFGVIGPESLLPDLLAAEGVWGRHEPDDQALTDMQVGVKAALDLGARDMGQGVVARSGEVLAEEDAAGTDALLERCGGLGRAMGPGGVLVKVKKPGQEAKVDLPAIGAQTVRLAAKAGLRGIAVEAGGSLVIDKDAVVRAADEAGLFVIGIRTDEYI